VRRHGCLVISLMLVTSCSMFIGPPPDEPDPAIQARDSKLRSDYDAWTHALESQKAGMKLPHDARLWVRLPFDSGVASVDEDTHKILHELVSKYRNLEKQTVKDHASIRHRFLLVQGFCDNEPIGGYDGSHNPPAHHYKSLLALSEARAVNVAEILMQSGIPHEKVLIQAFGATHFIASNASDSERQKNRRVDVYLVER